MFLGYAPCRSDARDPLGCFSGSDAVPDTVLIKVFLFGHCSFCAWPPEVDLSTLLSRFIFLLIQGAWYVCAARLMILAIAKKCPDMLSWLVHF